MNKNKLNKFSRDIYNLLIVSYPNWIELINNDPYQDSALYLKIPSPLNNTNVLEIDTLNYEITVGFGAYHEHFGWSGVSNEEAFQKAKVMIDNIINDTLIVASVCRNVNNDTNRISTTVNIEELEEFRQENFEFNDFISWSKNVK
jgi:hypothetical protein